MVTEEGKEYYNVLGEAYPTIYPYEQPLINEKWVVGFGDVYKRQVVRQAEVDGHELVVHGRPSAQRNGLVDAVHDGVGSLAAFRIGMGEGWGWTSQTLLDTMSG